MDKVRFTIGSNHVFQGFHTKGDNGMIGALVFVTADTLRAVTDHLQNDLHTKEFDKQFNAPTEDWETLAFGDSGTIKSPIDGITPLYRLTLAEAVIVQRFNPDTGRSYQSMTNQPDGTIHTETKYWGEWVNEDTIDGFVGGWSDTEPGTFEPVTHGFVINRKDVAEGRGNAPLIETEADRKAREAKEDPERCPHCGSDDVTMWAEDGESADADLWECNGCHKTGDIQRDPIFALVAPKPAIAFVTIEMTDGTEAKMEFSSDEHQSGTTYDGGASSMQALSAVENAITEAVVKADLWPTKVLTTAE